MSWYEGEGNKYSITKKGNEIPDIIAETEDAVLKEVIGCIDCGKAFKIVSGELNFMRTLNLPIPDIYPKCREKARLLRTNPPRLYNRNCVKCGKEMKISYSPERPEIIYCEKCYQKEVY